MVSEQHRPLRVASGEHEQLVDGVTGVETIGAEQGFDVVSSLGDGEWWQLERSRLTVEGALAVGEQGVHQGRLAAREDVRGSAAVVLNHRAKQPIKCVVCDEQVLELVEADNRHSAVSLVQA